MSKVFEIFERITRNSSQIDEKRSIHLEEFHPFEVRNIHPSLPREVRDLFDDGHYSQATFEAFKFLENEIKRHTGLDKTGKGLMFNAFTFDLKRGTQPKIKLTDLMTETAQNEQEGYSYIFAGVVSAIRNPRGHENLRDDVDTCLDHLSLASMLLRRLEAAGYKPIPKKG